MIRTRKSKKFRRKAAQILFTATAGDNTLHLRSRTNGFDCTIYWGDGSSTACPADGGNIIHNYAIAGDYLVSIFGKIFSGFYVNNQTGKEKYKELYSMGKWDSHDTTTMVGSFYGCSELVYIMPNALKYLTDINSVLGTFRTCAKLQSIPVDLFKYNTKINTVSNTFNGCRLLAEIPVDLFRYNPLVTTFGGVFGGCWAISSLPADLFRYNTEVTSFSLTFYDTRMSEVPADLFKYNVKAINFTSCFNFNSKLTSIPVDLFRYNINAVAFESTFHTCNYLLTIPPDLFKYNTLATNFLQVFYACVRLQVRDDIFGLDYVNRFNGKSINFSNSFFRAGFAGTQGRAPELWNFTNLTATKTTCFGGAGNNAASLSNYADIPAEWM